MKFNGILLAAGIIAAALASSANVQTANAQNWTGIYIGANGGYAWGDTTASFTPNDVTSQRVTCGGGGGGTCPGPLSTDLNGGFGGIQVGYNHQINLNWLVGVE